MSKPKSPDTKNPSVDRSVDSGQINTQQKKGGPVRNDGLDRDQSEGSNEQRHTTARQGQGAGFSRNIH